MKKHSILCLVGESGSGKSTIADMLINKYKYKSVPSYTTRTKRKEDVNNTYHTFISRENFFQKKENGLIKCSTYFDDNYYGADEKMILNNNIYVIDCNGIIELQKTMPNLNIVSIYIHVPEQQRYEYMLKRGDNKRDIERRLLNDYKMFKQARNICKHTITNKNLNKTMEIINCIYQQESEQLEEN